MNLKWKMFFFALLVATIAVQGFSIIYAYSANRDNWSEDTCYIAFPLDYTPEEYWNLTEPDQYILEAIEYPGNWTEPMYAADSTFWDVGATAWADFNVTTPMGQVPYVPFLYNGTYYGYQVGLPGKRLKVQLLDEEPEDYWNLTNPDKYLMEAMESPGKWVTLGIDDGNWPPDSKPFEYNGEYYSWGGIIIDYWPWADKWEEPKHTAMGLAVIWVAVGSVYLVKNRKTKAEP